MDLQISRLRDGDHAAAVALWQAAGLTRPWNDPLDDLLRALATPTSTVLAGLHEDRLVATAMVGVDGHRGWVYYLAIEAAMRGQGLGRRMMRACETWVADRGVRKLNLMVRAENAAVVQFYQALGYQDAGVTVLSRWVIEG